MPKKIRLGILGGGGDSLIGVLHRVASFINDNYEIVGAVFIEELLLEDIIVQLGELMEV